MSAKRVLVAGAAGGIGTATVATLHAAGMRVAAVDRVGAAEIPVSEAPDTWILADLSDPDACTEAVAGARAALGGIDALVHAAGVARDGVLWKLSAAAWRETLSVNLESAFWLCRAAVPLLRDAGGGAIVLVSSINGERGKFGQSAYAASKAGLHGLARSLARETGRFGIRVNVVAPGMIRSDMTASLPQSAIDAAIQESCLGRIGEPEDVADVIAFLLSDAARHITGQVLRVDGGQYL